LVISEMAMAYSIEQLIESETTLPAHIVFDGFKYPEEKPFVTIEPMQRNNEQISKQRETISTPFRYQIGLFAETFYKRSEYQAELREIFLYSELPYYNDNGVLTDAVFYFEPNFNEVPMTSGDISNETENHRMYFDIEIIVHTHKNKGRI